MATYYVNGFIGSDANAGGEAAPWASINKALTTIVAGDAVLVKGGCTYTENSGAGYLAITQSWASQVRFICNSRVPAKIRGTSGIRSVYLANSNISFEGFDFASSNSGNTAGVLNVAGSPANCLFKRCRFLWEHDSPLASNYLVGLGSPTAVSNLTFEDCELIGSGAVSGMLLNNVNGIRLTRTKIRCNRETNTYGIRTLTTVQNLVVEDCEISGYNAFFQSGAHASSTKFLLDRVKVFGKNYAMLFNGATTGVVLTVELSNIESQSEGQGIVYAGSRGNITAQNIYSVAQNMAIAFPGDGAYTGVQSRIIRSTGITTDAVNGHAILIGDGGINCSIDECYPTGRIGLFGLVLKGSGHYVRNSRFIGGSRNSVYFKGAQDCIVEQCGINQTIAGGYAIEYLDDVQDSANNIVRNNEVTASSGYLVKVPVGIGTGNVQDKNTYNVINDGGWSDSVFGNSIASFSALQSAWNTYDATNDRLSSTGPTTVKQIKVDTETILATDGALAKLQEMITGSGANTQFTEKALEEAPAAEGGGAITIAPGVLQQERRDDYQLHIDCYVGETIEISRFVFDSNDPPAPVNLTGKSLQFVIETKSKVNVATIDAIDVFGDDNNGFRFDLPIEATAEARLLECSLRDLNDGKRVWGRGLINVRYAPLNQD